MSTSKSNTDKKNLFIELAQPNEKGESRWVSTDEFKGKYAELKLGNGFDFGRKGSGLYNQFYIDTKKEGRGSKITAIRLNGFRPEEGFNQNIRQDIKDTISQEACVILGTKGGKSVNMKIEVDHKDGRKDDERVSNTATQKLEDFQPLCKAANDFKRQKCKECKSTNKRWSASVLKGFEDFPYYEGGEDYIGTCIGCYLYDPVAYRKAFREWIIDHNS